MPEGPEVHYLVNDILNNCINQKLYDIKIIAGRYKKIGPPINYNKFKKSLPLKCLNVFKKGKVIFFYFTNNWYIISKLGMTGWWYFEGNKSKWHELHDASIILTFKKKLIFTDIRHFGTLSCINDINIINNELTKLAPDIFDNNIKFNDIYNRINILYNKIKNKLIEDVIINQKIVLSGIGNYLKSEILYEAKISPLRKISNVSINDWKNIFKIAKRKVNKMYELLKLNDMNIYFNNIKIYRQKYDAHNNQIIRHKTKENRSTFWVPAIQI
jgi:formamidopyrimidine-DNA glycosylase